MENLASLWSLVEDLAAPVGTALVALYLCLQAAASWHVRVVRLSILREALARLAPVDPGFGQAIELLADPSSPSGVLGALVPGRRKGNPPESGRD